MGSIGDVDSLYIEEICGKFEVVSFGIYYLADNLGESIHHSDAFQEVRNLGLMDVIDHIVEVDVVRVNFICSEPHEMGVRIFYQANRNQGYSYLLESNFDTKIYGYNGSKWISLIEIMFYE